MMPLQWSSLNALAILPSLVELKFKGNPLLEGKRTLLLNHISMFGFLLVIRLLDQTISDCR